MDDRYPALGAARVKHWLVVALVLLITLVIWATWAWAT
jgi:hypothetical protein